MNIILKISVVLLFPYEKLLRYSRYSITFIKEIHRNAVNTSWLDIVNVKLDDGRWTMDDAAATN